MEVEVRCARREDFTAICEIAAKSSLPVPVPERATLKRFRNIVADLGCDLYVATVRNSPVGFVHLAYQRDLLLGNRARLLALVASSTSTLGVLLETAYTRARRRKCHDIAMIPGVWLPPVSVIAALTGWRRRADALQFDLSPGAGQS